jgi:hypothetical protein
MSSGTELAWFKSSYSGSSGDDCVEVAPDAGTMRVRDSKVAGGPELGVKALAWTSFVDFAANRVETGVR